MKNSKICRFINSYSEIKGLQECRAVIYCAELVSEGVYMSVTQESKSGTLIENCICKSATFEFITDLLKYISENRIDLGCWYGVLDDMNIEYSICSEIPNMALNCICFNNNS